MSSAPRTAIVVGASITGLACALRLSKLGFSVTLLDASDGHRTKREVINSPPNMTRILAGWGIDLGSHSTRFEGFVFREGETDELVGWLDLPAEMIQDLGADYYYLHYSDVNRLLTDKAEKAGVTLQWGCRVYNVHLDSGVVCFRDEDSNSQTVTADLVIVAVGRTHLPVVGVPPSSNGTLSDTDGEEAAELREKYVSMVGHLSSRDGRQVPLSDLDRAGRVTFWMAPGGTISFVPSSNGEMDVFARFRVDSCAEKVDGIPPSILSSFSSRVQELVKAARLGLARQEPSDANWLCPKKTNVIFVGEAAHPWLPNGTHRHAMGIEDVATLGRLLSLKLPTHAVVAAYHAIRTERWDAALQSDREKLDYLCLPPGEFREDRNKTMRFVSSALANASADDSMLWTIFEDYLRFFNYDAAEAVDEWWNMARHSPLYQR